ncbi:MAG: hypothetical protein GX638_13420 [Crenarchaeota archaeon]|nr:hypothetical protein [Thermoproteota archaeon]
MTDLGRSTGITRILLNRYDLPLKARGRFNSKLLTLDFCPFPFTLYFSVFSSSICLILLHRKIPAGTLMTSSSHLAPLPLRHIGLLKVLVLGGGYLGVPVGLG